MVSVQVTVSGCHGIYPEMTSSSANNPFHCTKEIAESGILLQHPRGHNSQHLSQQLRNSTTSYTNQKGNGSQRKLSTRTLETDLVEETVEEIVVVKEVIDFYEEEETESFVEVAFWYEIAPCGRGQETSRNDGPSFSRRLQVKVPAQETSKIDDLPSWKLLRPEKSVF